MGFVYLGKVERLVRDIAENEDRLNERYREILGDERFQKLGEVARKVLRPESFFENIERFYDFIGQEAQSLGSGSSRNFFLTTLLAELNGDWSLAHRKAKVSSAFYISEDSFSKSASSKFTDRILAGYVHEYNHFVVSALQDRPLDFVMNVANTLLGQNITNPIKVVELARKLQPKAVPYELKIESINLASLAVQYDFEAERTTRIFDRFILEGIGINAPLAWRGNEVQYLELIVDYDKPPIRMFIDGDPFRGIEDKEVIARAIDWENNFKPLNDGISVSGILGSIRKLDIEKIPLCDYKIELERINRSLSAPSGFKTKYKKRKRR